MITLVEFSGLCVGNPVRLAKDLLAVGGRLVSYDPSSNIVMGTLRVNLSDVGDVERKTRFILDKVVGELRECRLWVKILPDPELRATLYKRKCMRIASSTGEIFIVKLEHYVYALSLGGLPGRTRLVVLCPSSNWSLGELTELVVQCREVNQYLGWIREDLLGVLRNQLRHT